MGGKIKADSIRICHKRKAIFVVEGKDVQTHNGHGAVDLIVDQISQKSGKYVLHLRQLYPTYQITSIAALINIPADYATANSDLYQDMIRQFEEHGILSLLCGGSHPP